MNTMTWDQKSRMLAAATLDRLRTGTKRPAKRLKAVVSIYDLACKAEEDSRYVALAIKGAANLGGKIATLQEAIQYLQMHATETGEDGVIDEVNFFRDLC